MTDHLFEPPKPVAALRPLTERQQRIYGLISARPGGILAEELGAALHAGQLRHKVDETCPSCGQDGKRALRERAIRQRVIRRAGGVWEPRDVKDRAAMPSSQLTDELPGESWEDIFGDAA